MRKRFEDLSESAKRKFVKRLKGCTDNSSQTRCDGSDDTIDDTIETKDEVQSPCDINETSVQEKSKPGKAAEAAHSHLLSATEEHDVTSDPSSDNESEHGTVENSSDSDWENIEINTEESDDINVSEHGKETSSTRQQSDHAAFKGCPDRCKDDRPIYNGAPISVTESILAILALTIKHNISGVCLVDILLLINLHLIKENNLFQKSLYKCEMFLKQSSSALKKHFFCSACYKSLMTEHEKCTCDNSSKGTSYFITVSIIEQLQELFMRDDFYKTLSHRFENSKESSSNIADIYDGSLYRKMQQKGFFLTENDLSFLWYTDGVPVFKSTKCTMWPVYLIVNELPFKVRFRKENLILAGIWVGSVKPNPNLYIGALVEEISQLKSGLHVKIPSSSALIWVRAILLLGACDLPAKCQFLNLIQFNGYYGCSGCEIRGERVKLPNGNSVHTYPYECHSVARTKKQTDLYSERALASGKPEMGVKGPSVFSKLMPDFITGTAIDSMHGVYSGVVKKLLDLWFDSGFSNETFSLSAVLGVVDDRLLNIHPPNFVERHPRSLKDLCHWKSTEFKNWFYYYSVFILFDVMKADYFNHYLKLVKGIFLLNSDSISNEDIRKSEELLHSFVRDFAKLYGNRFCTINLHMLLHLPQCVRNLGPLWSYNCFKFEDLNGHLLKLVHGTKHVTSQICKAHWYWLRLPRYLNGIEQGKLHDFLSWKRRKVNLNQRISDRCHSVGAENPLDEIPYCISSFIEEENRKMLTWKYHRLLKDGVLFVAESYTRAVRTKSSYVLYRSNGGNSYGVIEYFLKFSDCNCSKKCFHLGQHYAVIETVEASNEIHGYDTFILPSFLKQIKLSGEKCLLPVENIISMCVYVNVGGNESYIGALVNKFETE